MSNATHADRITSIVQRYDIISIYETRDSTGTALEDLMSRLNATDKWGMEASIPIGRSKGYKEQYVFFYRKDKARVVSSYLYPDPQDVYEREPFSVSFEYWSVTPADKRKVVLMGLHTRPADTPEELAELPATIRAVASHFRGEGGVIAMGDFNADCGYANNAEKAGFVIFNATSGFTSLLPDDTDTTTNQNSDCAYDRIISYGGDVRPAHAEVYNYTAALQLTENEALDISDHYPVQFELL